MHAELTLFEIAGILLTIAAVAAWLNERFLRLPRTIGLMLIALALSGGLILAGHLGLGGITSLARALVAQIDFNEAVLHGMLSFLLFAGALHVNLEDLMRHKWTILLLASAGVLLTTVLVGYGAFWVFRWLGADLPLAYCLVFGAIVAPTDPIAVLGVLKKAAASPDLEALISGESLFNDGVAVVAFLILLELATGEGMVTLPSAAALFGQEALGGAAFGLASGAAAYWMLRRIDSYAVEILITLALVTAGYAAAERIHVSAPIAMVAAGLLVGNHGRLLAMSEHTRQHLDNFWELVDELLNAVLFVLIGMEILALTFQRHYLLATAALIPLALAARLFATGLFIGILRPLQRFERGVVWVLTWGGLRGGISIALALALPEGPMRDVLLAVTYGLVVFSIVVQGLSMEGLVQRLRS